MVQTLLHRLLLHHPTTSNVTLVAGTVRGVNASENRTSIQSVTVRKLDGAQVTMDDVAIVAGEL
jgi:hypothetical protein